MKGVLAVMLVLMAPVLLADKHALLIGIADYSGTGFTSLEGPHHDVALVRNLLIRRFGVPEDNIQVLLDEAATHRRLSDAFAELASRVQPGDRVYIHYSGHGSYTRDLNGDERSGFDQTWVSHGARSHTAGEQSELDDFDVLDDEIQAWLAPILAKTDDVIFVSDSCHSASVTRGEAPRVRAIPVDERQHPLGNDKVTVLPEGRNVIRIGAARDVQSAAEFKAPDERHYGLFTWHWVGTLEAARPGITWREAFQRTAAQVLAQRGDSQRPRMEGERNRDIFGGDFDAPARAVMIKDIRRGGSQIILDAGLLNGVTKDSIYRLHEDGREGQDASSRLKITGVWATESRAEVLQGQFEPGDLVVEESHVYPFYPAPVFLNADYPETIDQPVLVALASLIDRLPEYTRVERQTDSELVLYVLRPRRDAAGVPVYRDAAQSLPVSDKSRPPEVWVLTPVEALLHENLKHGFADSQQGIQALRYNLRRLARVREVKALGNAGGGEPAIAIEAMHLVPVDSCPEPAADDCYQFPKGSFQVTGRYPGEQLSDRPFDKGQVLTFTVENRSLYDYYVYLLDIAPDGEIQPLFPRAGKSSDDALLPKTRTINLFEQDSFLILDRPGEEVVKVIVSRQPIDTRLLTQEGYQIVARGGALNPLEQLLANAMQGSRGSPPPIRNNQWGTKEFSFHVVSPGHGE